MRMSCWPVPIRANVIREAPAAREEWLVQVPDPTRLSTEKGQEAMLYAGYGEDACEQPSVCIVARLWRDLRSRISTNGMGWGAKDAMITNRYGRSSWPLIRAHTTRALKTKILDECGWETSLRYIIENLLCKPRHCTSITHNRTLIRKNLLRQVKVEKLSAS